MASIFSLFGEVFVDNERAKKGIKDVRDEAETTGSKFVKSFGNIAKKSIEVGASIATATGAIVGSMVAMANKTSETADVFDKASLRTGLEVEELQRLNYAAGQSGVQLGTLENSAKKLNQRISEVNNGNSKTTELFKSLGIAVKDSNGQMRSSTAIYNDVLLKLADIKDTTKATTIGTELFGKAYTDMKPLLASGAEEIETLKNRADELGLVMSSDTVTAGVKFGDTMSDITQSLTAVKDNLMNAIIPTLTSFLNIILEHMPIIQSMISKLAPMLIGFLNSVLPIFMQFVNTLLPILMDLFAEIFPILSDIIEGLLPIFTELLQSIMPTLIEVIRQLLPALLPILQAILPLLQPIISILTFMINDVLNPIISVITSIANVISKVLVGAFKGLTPVVNGVKTVFQNVFGTLTNIVKAPINAIISAINLFIKGLNLIKIPSWVPIVGGKGINLPLIQKLRVGMDYIPYDEMPAILHKGEAVLTQEENRTYQEEKNKKNELKEYTINNNITIEKLEVRQESDIEEIAEELYYLQKKELSA